MKFFVFLFLVLLVLEELNCAPLLYWSDGRVRWRVGLVTDCGFGPRHYHSLHSRPWELIPNYSQDPPRPTYLSGLETMANEDQLLKKTLDKPSNKILEKPIDIPTKPIINPLIDNISKTFDKASIKYLNKSPTNSVAESSSVRPFDDMPAENLSDDYV